MDRPELSAVKIMTEILNTANGAASAAAGKDDRYLMIYAVALLILGGASIIYKLSKFLEKLSDKQSGQTERLISVVEKNNGVVDSNTRILERVSLHFNSHKSADNNL